ncbi:MAG: WD40 repeat domain-containing protein [Gemmatimonadales bacterium]|nr:MAG: WD40 repeat domain-containing protein [Gemmatimonadales bacterium]
MFGMPIPPKRLRPNHGWSLDEYPLDVSIQPSGRLAALGLGDGTIARIDLVTGARHACFSAHPSGLCSVRWAPDGEHLASGGHDGEVRLWRSDGSLEARGVVDNETPFSPWSEHVAWTPDGPLLASSSGKRVHIWSSRAQLLRSYPPLPSTVTGLSWRPSSASEGGEPEGPILAASAYGGVFTYHPDRAVPLREYRWKGSVITLAWSPDGRFIATGDQDSTVHFWYVRSGRDLQMWGYPSKVSTLAWSPDSRWLATGGSPGVTVWDCSGPGPEGRKPLVLRGHEELVSALAWQPSGGFLASGASDGTVHIWAPTLLEWPVGRWEGAGEVTSLNWLPDPRRLLVTTGSGEVVLLDSKPLKSRVRGL